MYETKPVPVAKNAERLFSLLLFLYPEQYRKRFGREMYLLFSEMYQEELATKGSVGFGFWFSQLIDINKSVIEQHKELMIKAGIKKYLQQTLHINKYNVTGFIFLLPFLLMFATDLISRIAQGDMTHYNRPVYHYLSQTPLYWTPVLFTIVIVLPTLAILVNIIPLIRQKRKSSIFSLPSLKNNLITFALIAVALGCIAIIKLHDFAPCMVHGIFNGGLVHFWQMFQYCRMA